MLPDALLAAAICASCLVQKVSGQAMGRFLHHTPTRLSFHTWYQHMRRRDVVIVWFGCRCSGNESVTALICSGLNRTKPDTGYSHLLACSSVTYRGRNVAHVHLPFNDVTYNIDQTLELTAMSVVCRRPIVILYTKYLAKTLRMVQSRNKKCSETGQSDVVPSGTVPVSVLVLSLARCEMQLPHVISYRWSASMLLSPLINGQKHTCVYTTMSTIILQVAWTLQDFMCICKYKHHVGLYIKNKSVSK